MEVKVTEVPSQTGFRDSAIDMLTGSNGLTVRVNVFVGRGPPQVPVAFCNCLKYVVEERIPGW